MGRRIGEQLGEAFRGRQQNRGGVGQLPLADAPGGVAGAQADANVGPFERSGVLQGTPGGLEILADIAAQRFERREVQALQAGGRPGRISLRIGTKAASVLPLPVGEDKSRFRRSRMPARPDAVLTSAARYGPQTRRGGPAANLARRLRARRHVQKLDRIRCHGPPCGVPRFLRSL